MKKEIRKEIREFILNDVNMTLARLGISDPVQETRKYENKYDDTLQYKFESGPIRQMPMMFKKVVVEGYIVAVEQADSRFANWAEDNDIIVVSLEYRYKNFDMGENGCTIGRIIYAVKKQLPEIFEDFAGEDGREYYVRRIDGLKI